MAEHIEVYVHGDQSPEPRLISVGETTTIQEIAKIAVDSGVSSGGEVDIQVFLVDEDSPLTPGNEAGGCGIKHRHHIHCHRCRQIQVSVNYNGELKKHSFAPSVKGKRILDWALDAFHLTGVDAANKVLRVNATVEVDPEDHIGSFAKFPECSVVLSLTAVVRVEG